MADFNIRLSNGDHEVVLTGASLPSGISATASTEKQKGASQVRFVLVGKDAMGHEPFDSLVKWYIEETHLTLLLGDNDPIEGCSLRECSLNMSAQQLYITVYTKFPAQEVRHWFDNWEKLS